MKPPASESKERPEVPIAPEDDVKDDSVASPSLADTADLQGAQEAVNVEEQAAAEYEEEIHGQDLPPGLAVPEDGVEIVAAPAGLQITVDDVVLTTNSPLRTIRAACTSVSSALVVERQNVWRG